MADLSDSELFDSVIEGKEPAATQQNEPVIPAQPRDEGGRFASQQPELPAQASAPAPEPQAPVTEQQPAGGIPVGAVKAEREKRQAAEADAEALRREIAELRGMVQATRQPAPQPQQEPQQPISIFEDPEAFLNNQLSPVQQTLQETREAIMELKAIQIHGAEAVAAAQEAGKALFGTPEGRALAAKPGNLFDNLVQWHKQQQVMARIGSDPDKWLEAELEKRMSDPTFQAQYLERIRSGVSPTPTNPAQPVTSIPPSLSKLPAGGNVPQGGEPVNDGALFASVTSGPRGRR